MQIHDVGVSSALSPFQLDAGVVFTSTPSAKRRRYSSPEASPLCHRRRFNFQNSQARASFLSPLQPASAQSASLTAALNSHRRHSSPSTTQPHCRRRHHPVLFCHQSPMLTQSAAPCRINLSSEPVARRTCYAAPRSPLHLSLPASPSPRRLTALPSRRRCFPASPPVPVLNSAVDTSQHRAQAALPLSVNLPCSLSDERRRNGHE